MINELVSIRWHPLPQVIEPECHQSSQYYPCCLCIIEVDPLLLDVESKTKQNFVKFIVFHFASRMSHLLECLHPRINLAEHR